MKRTIFLYGLLWVSVTLFSGCTGGGESSAEDEHLEHHVSEHKPVSLVVAWGELKVRIEKLGSDSSPEEFAELTDIIKWLPELAGDSELKKPDWDKIEKLSQQMEASTATLDGAIAHRGELVAGLDQYAEIVSKAGRSTQVRVDVHGVSEKGEGHD